MKNRTIPLLLGISLLTGAALAQAGDQDKTEQHRMDENRMDDAPYGPTSTGDRQDEDLRREGMRDNDPTDRESIQEDWRRNAEERKDSDIRNPTE